MFFTLDLFNLHSVGWQLICLGELVYVDICQRNLAALRFAQSSAYAGCFREACSRH